MTLSNFLSVALPYAYWVYLVIAIVVFTLLIFLSAPYGRHNRQGWGPQMNATLGWTIMESPALFMPVLCLVIAGVQLTPVTLAFISLWYIHYVQRTIIYNWQRRHSTKQYPIFICALAFVYNIFNGYVVAWDVYVTDPMTNTDWLLSLPFICGVILFTVGMAINISSDRLLLRQRNSHLEGYIIPNQGLHRFVASPNYFGEMLEWAGFAIATWSVGGALFALFTIANLGPRAFSNRAWYRETFADYPKERKALIPFIL